MSNPSGDNPNGDFPKETPSVKTEDGIQVQEYKSWQKREKELLNKIEELQIKSSQEKSVLEKTLKIRTEERDNCKKHINKLEEKIQDACKKQQVQTLSENQQVEILKEQSEDLLTKAKGVIFEKTKVCQNQELQIEALTQQVTSLKEVISITKDLLKIRSEEVQQLQDKLNCMEEKIMTEKERHDLMHVKLDKMVTLNTELKREYETQLCLFAALRERYSERELAADVLPLQNGNNDQPKDSDN